MNQLTQINRILLFFLLIVIILYWGAPFLISFIFGVFFAFLMVPLCNLMERTRMHRIISSLLSTLVLFIIVGGTLFLFIVQVNSFAYDLPSVEHKIASIIESGQNTIESITNLSLGQQNDMLKERSEQILEKVGPFAAGLFGDMFSTIFSFFLVLVYVFLLLLYRAKIYDFILMYICNNQHLSTQDTLQKIGKVAFQYSWGRVQVMLLLGVLFYITFLLFGLPYALLFSLFGAVITIIPYIGPLVSGLFPILFSILYFDSMQKIIFFSAVVIVIQLIESYVFEPLILGKEVQLNPMVIIVVIVMGGIIWGLAGMILFVPMIAIIKIISLSQPGLKPIAFILGHENKEECNGLGK